MIILKLIKLFLVICWAPYCCSDEAHKWSYQNQEMWPGTCNGNKQSPINLHRSQKDLFYCARFQFSQSTNQLKNATITNNGHSIEIRFPNDPNLPTLRKGGLGEKSTFVFDSFHFHWGSEHTFYERRYPLEAHFIYYNAKLGSLANALRHPKNVAVLGAIYDDGSLSHAGLATLSAQISSVAKNINKPVLLKNLISLSQFLPELRNEFYRYEGSLTTPNCTEGIIWTVFPYIVNAPKSMLDQLTEINDGSGALLKRNYRRLQKLNGRKVMYVRT